MDHQWTPSRGQRLVKSLYFSLDNSEDVRLLGLILTLPPSQHSRILKAALREALPKYLTRHYPGVTRLRLGPEAIAEAVTRARRPARRRRGGARPALPEAPTQPVSRGGQDRPGGPPGTPHDPVPATPPGPAADERRQEAERKLDQLLRSLTK